MTGFPIRARKTSDGRPKEVECGDGGEIKVVLCGIQLDGTVTPLLCDGDGKLVVTS